LSTTAIHLSTAPHWRPCANPHTGRTDPHRNPQKCASVLTVTVEIAAGYPPPRQVIHNSRDLIHSPRPNRDTPARSVTSQSAPTPAIDTASKRQKDQGMRGVGEGNERGLLVGGGWSLEEVKGECQRPPSQRLNGASACRRGVSEGSSGAQW
jgi:hypothetical protein